MTPVVDVVVPTAGRPELGRLLLSLAAAGSPRPARVIVVDDRKEDGLPLALPSTDLSLEVVKSGGRGPAAARNLGWRTSRAEWTAFLDDDVVCPRGWLGTLRADLVDLPEDVAGSQGRIRVRLPAGRRPTDWERNVKGLETALWATADMAYRRSALVAVGGFEERFPRPYREDADLALRVEAAGWRLVQGRRQVEHPVPPARSWESLRRQAGNADDALMLRLHGRGWRRRIGGGRGRRARNLLVTATALIGAAGALGGRRGLALLAGGLWAAATAEFAWQRIAPGPRTPAEVVSMVLTSALIPPLATWSWARGLLGFLPGRRPPAVVLSGPSGRSPAAALRRWIGRLRAGAFSGRFGRLRAVALPRPPARPLAVLFDRDGTLVEDVPYNGDPALVRPLRGARAALDRLRQESIPIAVVSNQSGVARGILSRAQVEAVNRRIEELLGPIGTWLVCPHGPDDRCSCRKPEPGLVLAAAERLGVPPDRCVLVGDIGADLEAARAAGARGILVPTPVTRPEEVAAAGEVAPDLEAAVARVLS
jgi:HAD superfamily hydrolase (TIGR01662 family)